MQLRIDFNIRNFWKRSDRFNNFNSVFFWHKQLSKNKSLEFDIIENFNALFNFELDVIFSGRDHAGPSLVIGGLGLEISLRVYDHRHWDYQNNKWEEH